MIVRFLALLLLLLVPQQAPRPLVFLAGDLTPAQQQELALLAPKVRVLNLASREEALAHAAEADGIDARFATPGFLKAAPHLVWVQAMSAGVDRYVGLPGIADNDKLVLTNLKGVHGPAIADHVFAMLLSQTRDLRFFAGEQAQSKWTREGSGTRPLALQDRTLLVVGLGGIGSEVAQRAHGFGMKVIATRRNAATASPEWIEHVGPPEELAALLPKADVVVICVPLTKETEKLFDAKLLGLLKPSAFLVNVARGKVVDTAALVAALQAKKLAGACLDVSDPEPLPKESPLWQMKNVVITPHVAAEAELTDERSWAVLAENLRHFAAGEPLVNVVDKKAGY
jgi:phosphoglycerate dehydrogenase-like enzyme